MKEVIGLDIGSTRTKKVGLDDESPSGLSFGCLDVGGRPFTQASADALAQLLSKAGYSRVGLTGAGAGTFAEAAKAFPNLRVVMHGTDPFDREIFMQAAGIQSLCRRQGEPLPESFTLVTIGTGVSYTRVSGRGYTTFPLGNPIGGGFMVGVSGLSAKEIADFGRTDAHGDLLIKDRFPHHANTPVGEMVLASYGNMGHDSIVKRPSTAAKCVATQVVRDLLLMELMPDWKRFGPVVFAGTPVDEYEILRGWLVEYCGMLRMPFRFVEHSACAGALGAYEFACEATP